MSPRDGRHCGFARLLAPTDERGCSYASYTNTLIGTALASGCTVAPERLYVENPLPGPRGGALRAEHGRPGGAAGAGAAHALRRGWAARGARHPGLALERRRSSLAGDASSAG